MCASEPCVNTLGKPDAVSYLRYPKAQTSSSTYGFSLAFHKGNW